MEKCGKLFSTFELAYVSYFNLVCGASSKPHPEVERIWFLFESIPFLASSSILEYASFFNLQLNIETNYHNSRALLRAAKAEGGV